MIAKRRNVFVICLLLLLGMLLGQLIIPRVVMAAPGGQSVTPPNKAPNEEFLEIVRTQQEDWGTFVVYADKETRNGFMLTYDRNGLPIGMQALKNVMDEPMRYDEEGDLLDRLLPEQYKIEVPAIYGRQESAPFTATGKIKDISYVLASYGNNSSVGLDYSEYDKYSEDSKKFKGTKVDTVGNIPHEVETLAVSGKTYCTTCVPPCGHECPRQKTDEVQKVVEYLRDCSHCDSISIFAKVVVKTETDPYTEWEVPRLWYEAEYAPEEDDGFIDSHGKEIKYKPKDERWLED